MVAFGVPKPIKATPFTVVVTILKVASVAPDTVYVRFAGLANPPLLVGVNMTSPSAVGVIVKV
ncbi:hypothetical protein A2554_02630 [Candidatus Nomurabacteria bacterium RIFOXYD2_FULL_35_12]|nr:MAG: hypothetical protein A2554_02630 [Candidatus Nomurabacteria bacterium RIFOXYD2_FULL_35_12]